MSTPELDTSLASQHADETRSGERFGFGENWRDFLRTVDETRINVAIDSLKFMLGVETLEGKRFVDIGSGSGLFSLAAHRLGAEVTSFDYDPASVACTSELRKCYGDSSESWRILHGSALDKVFLEKLGVFDVVYSWGVLHHTGNIIKHIYCSGILGKTAMSFVFVPYWAVRSGVSNMVRLRVPWHTFATYKRGRGMSMWHDMHDWLGGYPFETAKPEGIILPIQRQGFTLVNLITQYGSMGCVEYVFRRTNESGVAVDREN